jgi:N-acetyl-anhydromuramyl-L-alanine amidase AmpD
MNIINHINILPWHPTKRWGQRNLSLIKNIVIHQSMSYYKQYSTKDIEGVNNYHITPSNDNHISKTGCPHICYTFVIDDDGKTYQCNEYKHITWHCKGHNIDSLGILILGDFDGPSYNGKYEKPTQEQMESLYLLLNYMIDQKFYRQIDKKHIFGHTELQANKENCPGNYLMKFVDQYRTKSIINLNEI